MRAVTRPAARRTTLFPTARGPLDTAWTSPRILARVYRKPRNWAMLLLFLGNQSRLLRYGSRALQKPG